MTTGSSCKNGFIGLEALVAFAVLTLILVAVYQAFAGSYQSINKTTEREIVLAEARSLLESIGVSRPLETGLSTGVFPSGLLWTIRTEEIRPSEEARLRRHWIRMNTKDRNGRQLISLETIVVEGSSN